MNTRRQARQCMHEHEHVYEKIQTIQYVTEYICCFPQGSVALAHRHTHARTNTHTHTHTHTHKHTHTYTHAHPHPHMICPCARTLDRSLSQGKLAFATDTPLESSLAPWDEDDEMASPAPTPHARPHTVNGHVRDPRERGGGGGEGKMVRGSSWDTDTPPMTSRPFSVDLSKSS